MNIGDRLLCIKEYRFNEILFLSDKYYIIEKINVLSSSKQGYNTEIYLRGEDGSLYWFLLNSGSYGNNFYVYNYFVNIKDERVKKLEKLGRSSFVVMNTKTGKYV